MTRLRRGFLAMLLLALSSTAPLPAAHASETEEHPDHLRDRGDGVPTSMFGTSICQGELLVYPFLELYHDRNFEYKPSELGYGLEVDHRGRFTASEQLLFLA